MSQFEFLLAAVVGAELASLERGHSVVARPAYSRPAGKDFQRADCMRYDYPVHRAKNLSEAVTLAKYLKQLGNYDIFRGQNQNFPLIPSIFRRVKDMTATTARLDEFRYWISQRQELSSLHSNEDALMAVAQHYGIPTPFLDFTTDPEVAGFFASYVSDGARQEKKLKRNACIVCANRGEFERSWADLNARDRIEGHGDLVRVVEIDVHNLWRLQAQSGLFLDARVDSTLLEMFSFLLHIEFPQNSKNDVELYNKYYPINKSHLELLLDQYFLVESYPERERQQSAIFDHKIVAGPQDFIGQPSSFVNSMFPPRHESWSDETLRVWINEPAERFDRKREPRIEALEIDLSSSPIEALGLLRKQLMHILGGSDA